MKVVGMEIFLETLDNHNGVKQERIALVPLQIEPSKLSQIFLRIRVKPNIGTETEFLLDMNDLRRYYA